MVISSPRLLWRLVCVVTSPSLVATVRTPVPVLAPIMDPTLLPVQVLVQVLVLVAVQATVPMLVLDPTSRTRFLASPAALPTGRGGSGFALMLATR